MAGKSGGGEGIIFIIIVLILMFWVASGFRDGQSGAGQVSGSTVTRAVPASGNLTPAQP